MGTARRSVPFFDTEQNPIIAAHTRHRRKVMLRGLVSHASPADAGAGVARPSTSSTTITPLALGTALLLAAGSAACSAPTAQQPQPEATAAAPTVIRTGDPNARGFTDADFPRVQQIAEGVYTYEQLRSAGEEKFTTVSLFVVTADGVLVADGQGNVEETERLIEHIRTITDAPITDVVVGSDHGDHTGGNAAFPQGARVWAHPTSAAVLASSTERAAQREGATPAPLTTDLVEERAELQRGDKTIVLQFLGRAHTGGDLMVYLPAEKVLFMSEAYLNRIFPAMRSAYPSEWVAMIEKAQAMDVDGYLPGHGFVESPAILAEELETYRRALVQVIEEARRLHAAGLGVDETVEQARFGELEGWTLRSSQSATAIRRVYMELNGELDG
jgi:glyoxylase-like metal-dependent hydrolase (beta-lactamase superfamily II)